MRKMPKELMLDALDAKFQGFKSSYILSEKGTSDVFEHGIYRYDFIGKDIICIKNISIKGTSGNGIAVLQKDFESCLAKLYDYFIVKRIEL